MGELPLQLEDASRNDDDLSAADAAAGAVRVNQDVRLNNRVIDLRTPANQGIFRMQHGVCQLFRQFLLSQVRLDSAVEGHSAARFGATSGP